MFSVSKGRQFELDVLGTLLPDDGWWRRFSLVEFGEAIEFALRKQPESWNPLDPPTHLGKLLLSTIREVLSMELGKLGYSIDSIAFIVKNTGLYVALGTAADAFYETDAIVCCDLGEIAPFVTIDLQVDDFGEELSRGDHVIIERDHFTQNAETEKFRLQNIAGVIAECLIEKISAYHQTFQEEETCVF